MDDLFSTVANQIRNALINASANRDTKTVAVYVNMHSLTGIIKNNELSNDMVVLLEGTKTFILNHNYDPSTGLLTVDSYDYGVDVTAENGTDITPIDTSIFTIVRNGETYRCYTAPQSGTNPVTIERTVYYCKRSE